MALTDAEERAVDTQNDIIDINLNGATRTRFRINGDSSAIIELNLSDLRVVDRFEKGLKTIEKQMSEISEFSNDDENLSEKLNDADKKMREQVDYIFDYPVSAVCARYGTMYDPKDGKFLYETIIDGLMKLYSDNIKSEVKRIENRIQKHTGKYSAKKKK